MQQAGTYGGGYMPPAQNYASTAPPSYNMDAYGGTQAPYGAQGGYAQVQEPAYSAQEPAYNNPNAAYAPPQPSYAPAAPSYSPGAPSYDYYSSSAPPSSTPPAQSAAYLAPSYGDSGYTGLQSYASGGSQAYQQVGYEQSGYSGGGYEQGGYGGGVTVSGYERDGYGAQRAGGSGYSEKSYEDGGFAEVYAYDGGQAGEPYGARGSGGGSWGTAERFGSSGGSKVARAVPKVESDNTGGGIQKYRVKLLPDVSSSTAKDVICQVL
jgi:hypothetical protein